MARDAQDVEMGVDGATLVDTVPLIRNPQSAWAPFQLVSFRGSFDLDGSGVGDTADCRIKFPLPGNNVYQLHSFAMHVEDTADYTEGRFELYYAPKPGEFGLTTELNYHVVRTSASDPANLDTRYQYLVAPGASAGFLWSYEQSPFRLIFGGSAVGGTDPVLWIGSDENTNVDSGTCRLAVNFLGYTLEQWAHSALYAGLSSR